MIKNSARKLDQARMIRYIEHTGALYATDLGRTASHFYINYASIEVLKYTEFIRFSNLDSMTSANEPHTNHGMHVEVNAMSDCYCASSSCII